MNCAFYGMGMQSDLKMDKTVKSLLDLGYTDSHGKVTPSARATSLGNGLVLDIVAGFGVGFSYPGIGTAEVFETLSDHLPVYTTAKMR